jgi:hypothetical protein
MRYELSDWWRRKKERWQMAVAWSLPTWIVKWTVVRAFANATTGKYGDTEPDTVNYSMLCERNAF